MALKNKKIPTDFTLNETLSEAIRSRTHKNKLTCASAFGIAKTRGVELLLVGKTADVLQIELDLCQLGLFGYPGHSKGWQSARVAELAVPAGLEEAIRSARDSEGELSCLAAWEAAAKFGIPRMQVGYIADKLGIRIRHCQLGAF
jgi:hypothetical protein